MAKKHEFSYKRLMSSNKEIEDEVVTAVNTDAGEVTEKKQKTNESDHAFRDDFEYTHDNPYHERLGVFDQFVLRDAEGEGFKDDWSQKAFGNDKPLEVEVGTGYGHFMQEYTQKHPEINFVGLDHRFKRSYHLAQKLNTLTHKNFKYLRARGERLGHLFGESELSKLFYFFPDPWPKKRHHKKRLFQKTFLDQTHKLLCADGELIIKTDHDGYFQWMLDHLEGETRFEVVMQTWDLRAEHPDHFLAGFVTKFERIFLDKGIKIKAMVLRNKK